VFKGGSKEKGGKTNHMPTPPPKPFNTTAGPQPPTGKEKRVETPSKRIFGREQGRKPENESEKNWAAMWVMGVGPKPHPKLRRGFPDPQKEKNPLGFF